MQREIDKLKEQLHVSVEGMHRTVTKLHKQQVRSMEELRQMLVQPKTVGRLSQFEIPQFRGDYGQKTVGRLPQSEIPQFRDENLKGWLFKYEQFFRINNIPANDKVRLMAAHLEDQALQWHRIYLKAQLTRELSRWKDYVFALYNRFGARFDFDYFDNCTVELMTLEQSGNEQNYINDFDELSKLVDLREDVAINYFVRELSNEIEVGVTICEPKTLHDTFSLAKLQEQLLDLAIRKQSCIKTPPLLSNFSNPKETSIDRFRIVQPPNDFKPQVGELVGEVHSSNKRSRLTLPTQMNKKQPQGLCCWSCENLGDGNKRRKEHLFALAMYVKDVEKDELCKLVERKVVKEEKT